VSKAGDARVGLVGFPSVGKSTLLSKLTATESEVAAYEFTTLTAIPGTILYKVCARSGARMHGRTPATLSELKPPLCAVQGARIQLVDLPGIIEGAKDGKGRGKQVQASPRCRCILIFRSHPRAYAEMRRSGTVAQVIGVARTCSLILLVLAADKPITHKKLIEYELEGFGMRWVPPAFHLPCSL
jgi:small GTP-binding protein